MERTPKFTRRQFVKSASSLTLALPAMTFIAACHSATTPVSLAQSQGSCEWCASDIPANPLSKTVIPPLGEAGEALVISGTIYKEDGRTPAEGITVYAYHTNAAGLYPKNTPNDGRPQWRHGYLRGWMRTDANGRYEFRTVKPGGYPGRPDPAHIHMTVQGAGYPEFWINGLWFEGDQRITQEMRASLSKRGGFEPIIRLTQDGGGVWRGTRDIQLERH